MTLVCASNILRQLYAVDDAFADAAVAAPPPPPLMPPPLTSLPLLSLPTIFGGRTLVLHASCPYAYVALVSQPSREAHA